MPQPRLIVSVVGTRPNFMKVAPVAAELARYRGEIEHVLVHTGQHYDRAMSEVFLQELGIGEPDHLLDVGPGTHAGQTARVMERLEPILDELTPSLVIVPGDVNSTMAGALTAVKLGIPVAHIEAGLRSFDWTMPEEINRVVTDRVSSYLFIHSPEARRNLLAEGSRSESIHYVGNTMIDTLVAMRERIAALRAPEMRGLRPRTYIVVTLHRPSLVDGPLLLDVMHQLQRIAEHFTVVFPLHPRTKKRLEGHGVDIRDSRLRLIEPVGYLEFLGLVTDAAAVLTDSGGIQEETTFLGIPCFTLRANTERPVTCELGTNTMLGLAPERIAELPALIPTVRRRAASAPPLWDGRAAKRLVEVLLAASHGELDVSSTGLAV